MRSIRLSLFLFLVVCLPRISYAWGCTGHQTVALIALHQLQPSTRAHVAALLRTYPYTLKRSCSPTATGQMSTYSTWADDARTTSAFSSTAEWHFWDIPRTQATATEAEFCDSGCVVKAIEEQLAILKQPPPGAAGKKTQKEALIFLIHLVGDAHQPLHIVDNGDRGGNCLPVKYTAAHHNLKPSETRKNGVGTGSYTPNLHEAWDKLILGESAGYTGGANDTKLKAFVSSIESEYADPIASLVSTPGTPEEWALESHGLALANGYSALSVNVPQIAHPQHLDSCLGVSSGLLPLNETVDVPYSEQATPVIREQLARGGARLAALLNSVWTQ
ncbi:S1/P1 nuclease [Terriglobus tenax]|uniref:S1/P1 nuclease n=1 Tax=Terriglobus tenax TaxID=1111115 RepID=UPI0021E08621|nr:S1/P1 nuclease [Terriglobus tenax]